MRGEHEPGEEGQCSGEAPAAGQFLLQRLEVGFVPRIDRIDRRDRRHRDLARGHGGEQCEADILVEPDRRDDHVDAVGDLAGDRDLGLFLARAGAREAGQGPQDDGRDEDDPAGALKEDRRALPQAKRDIGQPRHLIFGQFHHERAAAALDHGVAQDERGKQRADDPGDVQAEHDEALHADAGADASRGDERGDDQCVDGQARGTGHQRRDENGGQPILGIVDGAGRHDSGDRAGEAGQQGDEGAAAEAGVAHQPIHDERRADHVAGRFEHQDEQEQDQYLGQEDDHRADPGEQAVDDQGAEQAVWKRIADGIAGGDGDRLERVGGGCAPREYRLEHDEQYRGEDDNPADRMEQDAVEAVGNAAGRGFADDRAQGDVAGAALERKAVVAGAGAGADYARGEQDRVELGEQLRNAAFAHRDGLDHGNAELGREFRRVEHEPVACRQIDHVERDHDRQAEVDQLQREAQMIVEIGRVDHHQQNIGQAFPRLLAEQDVAGDGFVGAGRVEPVGAGKIDQFGNGATWQGEPSDVALDRYARIVSDLLTGAGERVEQRRLAGIGVADDRDQRCGVHPREDGLAASGMTWTARAWARRIATVIRPTRTASGSAPNGPRWSGSTETPSSKPKWRRRLASLSPRRAQSIAVIRARSPIFN